LEPPLSIKKGWPGESTGAGWTRGKPQEDCGSALLSADWERSAGEGRWSSMDALLILGIYIAPFLMIGIIAQRWMARRGVNLSDVRAQGGSGRKRSRFLLGIWRHEE
jgi:hypothetical protein